MSEYRCSQCGTRYSFDEYRDLETIPRSEGEPKYGVEAVCECGARFHSDRWRLVDGVEHDGEELRVSTVALSIGHGPNHDQWFETCVFHDSGSRIVDRYHTQDAAEDGHSDVVDRLEDGAFEFEETGQRLVMADE